MLAFAACSDTVDPRAAGSLAPVTVTATLTPAQQAIVAGMSVEVTGPGITTPILATLSVSGATVNGTVQVPVGASRTFTVRAFDARGVETHEGSATAGVVAGTNPPLTIRLTAREGTVPIDVTVGTYGVTLTPPTASVAVNGEITLTANVTTNGGTAAGPLTWGVVNPMLATLTVAGDGRSAVVRGKLAGTTRVVASYEGVAAASTVTITDAPPANQPPVARANGPYAGTVGGAIAFSSSGSSDPDGTIVSYAWSFGDGTTSTQANPSKGYAATGSYVVSLTVTDDDGATSTSTTTAVVTAPAAGTFAATKVVAGDGHTCALTSAGAVFCWGLGTSGQLGNGASASSSTPVQVIAPTGPLGSVTFTDLRAGGNFTCGWDGGGTAYCWGLNSSGQLGIGDTQNRDRPTRVMGLLSVWSLGYAHACGQYAPNPRSCWGSNAEGQITGTAGGYFTTPQTITDPPGVTTSAMLVGGTFTCLSQSATISGTTQRSLNCRGTGPGSWTVNQGTSVASLMAGYRYACNTFNGSGTLQCWGDNAFGQFGNGMAGTDVPPTAVSANGYVPSAFGGGHTCGSYNGSTACAGNNANGQLGNGSSGVPSLTPVIVSGGNLTGLAAGFDHSCGIRGGIVHCWGTNTHGQLGDGTTAHRNVPTGVTGYSTPNQMPSVSIQDAAGRAGQPITISALGTDPDGTIVSYTWAFSDQPFGGTTTTTGSITRTYAAAGTYQVTVAVTDNRGAMSPSRTAIVTVQP